MSAASVYQDEAERARVERALAEMGVVHKTRRTPRPAHPPELEEHCGARFEARNNMRVIVEADPHGGAPVGSVDLCSLSYPDGSEEWERGARIRDVVATVEHHVNLALEAVGEHAIAPLHQELRALREGLERKIAILERDNKSMKDEIIDLASRLERVRAVRGLTDGDQLPPTLTQRKPRAAAKRKPVASARGSEARP
jgi:hypothetical protein